MNKIFLGIAVFATCLYPAPSTTPARTLYNATGGVLGYVDSGNGKVAVRNSGRAVIGYVDDKGTYDKGRKTIAKSRLPGLLFKCGH